MSDYSAVIFVVPESDGDQRTWFDRNDSLVRALTDFEPKPVRVFQKTNDDSRKVFRIVFDLDVSTHFQAQSEATRLYDLLAAPLSAAAYRVSKWHVDGPL